MRTFIFFILSLLATRGISVNNNTKIEIPFSLDRNLILIQVNIDAIGNRNFIFDTGTEGIMLMDSIANNYKVSGLDTIVTPTGEFVGTELGEGHVLHRYQKRLYVLKSHDRLYHF